MQLAQAAIKSALLHPSKRFPRGNRQLVLAQLLHKSLHTVQQRGQRAQRYVPNGASSKEVLHDPRKGVMVRIGMRRKASFCSQ